MDIKKLIAICLVIVMLLCGCSKADGAESVTDLTGEWVQVNSSSSGSYQKAYISNGIIDIYWITNGGETQALYWSGTYDLPDKPTKAFSWKSTGDRNKMDKALLASGSDEKDFSFDGNVISYEVSAMGVTSTVSLEQISTSVPVVNVDSEPEATTAMTEMSASPPVLVDYGYTISNGFLYCAFILKNPNADYGIKFPEVRITAKDEVGVLINTSDVMPTICLNPDQELYYGSLIFKVSEFPHSVEINVLEPDSGDYVEKAFLDDTEYVPVSIINPIVRNGRAMGEVENPNPYDFSNARVTVFFYDEDGKIIAGNSTYLDIDASTSTPFSIITGNYATENYKIFVTP